MAKMYLASSWLEFYPRKTKSARPNGLTIFLAQLSGHGIKYNPRICYNSFMIIATLVAVFTLGLLSLFQIALALGAPMGQFAWGGKHRILPHNLRIGSMLSLFIYVGIAVCLLSKSGIIHLIPQGTLLDILVWTTFAYLVLGVFMNAISRSKRERYTMTPVVILLAICTLTVALA